MKAVWLLLLGLPLFAQPRSPEIFGQVGWGAAQDDEGGLGKGFVYGGAVTVPLASCWAIDLDVQHIRTLRTVAPGYEFGSRRTLLSPAVVYRRGSERTYWFAGGGAGGRIESLFSRAPGLPESTGKSRGTTILGRTGFVTAVTKRLLIRTDVYAVASFLVADAGVKIGIGYRFQRQ
jgi:hypothetical protein